MSDKLDDFLNNMDIPAPSENARKMALNMASSEYEAYQQEKNQKKSQGFFSPSRLMGMNNSQHRRSKMKNRKLLYGGMATAMVVVLAGGAALYQTRTHELVAGKTQTIIGYDEANQSTMATVSTAGDVIQNVSAEGLSQATKTTTETSINIPFFNSPEPNKNEAVDQEEMELQEAPLDRWSRLQDERVQQLDASSPERKKDKLTRHDLPYGDGADDSIAMKRARCCGVTLRAAQYSAWASGPAPGSRRRPQSGSISFGSRE